MAIVELAVVYLACGIGCASAQIARGNRDVIDAALLVTVWPLFGPFVFLRSADVTGISTLLPSHQAVEPLRLRLDVAQKKLGDIDILLARPAFNAADVGARISELARSKASATALASAQSRKRSIGRLAERRKVLATELEELAELFLQLETQREVLRVTGSQSTSTRDLIADIQARLESIDDIEDENLP